MAWTLRQTKTNFNDGLGHTTIAATFDSNPLAGSLIVVTLGWGNTGAIPTLGATGPDTFDNDVQVNNTSAGYSLAKFHAYNATAGSYTVTGTNSQTRTNSRIIIEEFTGGQTSPDPIDQSIGNDQAAPGTGTDAVTSTARTTTTDGQLVHGSMIALAAVTNTKGTGFTDGTDDFNGVSTEYLTQTSAGSIAATFTISGAARTFCILTTYRAALTASPMFRGS